MERWVKEFGPEAARRICSADNQKPPFTIRANTLKISREELQTKLREAETPSQLAAFSRGTFS